MNREKIIYHTKTAGENDIFGHLTACDTDFIPPLSTKVDLKTYSKKLIERSITFEAWDDQLLAGLVAVYFTNTELKSAYITNVSLIKKYMHHGIASELMNLCISYAKKTGFNEINLEVNKNNSDAIGLYEKFKFRMFDQKEEQIFMKLVIQL